jgi:ribosome maturation factor RimP
VGKNIVSVVAELIQPVFDGGDLELYDLEYVKEGPHWYLRVYIDKPGPVTVNDCERVSRQVETFLDAADPIPQAFILEVCSPGVDRALKKDADFERYQGQTVKVKLYKPLEGRKEYRGVLVARREGLLHLLADGAPLAFPLQDVAAVRLAPEGL